MTKGCLWWSAVTDHSQRRHPFSFTVIWSLYPAMLGQAIPSAFGFFRLAKTGIVFDFDDGLSSVHTNAFPIMKKYGIKGTCHVITSYVGTGSCMTVAQLRELQESGWTIDSHGDTHVNLSLLDEAGQLAELKTSMDWLKARGFDYDTIATPYGGFNTVSLKLFQQLGYRMHRGYSSLGYGSDIFPFINPWRVRSDPIANTEESSVAITRVDTNMNANRLMFFTCHGIAPGTAPNDYDPAKLQAVIEHIIDKGYPTYNFTEVADSYYNHKILGQVMVFETASETLTNGIDSIYIGSDEVYANHFDGAYKDLFVTKDMLGCRELANLWNCKY